MGPAGVSTTSTANAAGTSTTSGTNAGEVSNVNPAVNPVVSQPAATGQVPNANGNYPQTQQTGR